MSSYQTRPGYGQQQPYGSSGYESIPRAPRSPHFPEPSARGHQYNQTGPYAPHGYVATSRGQVPPAPHSLAPVAMASARGAAATGPQAIIQTMDTGPSRPSAKAGMSILLAGAIIGGLIGAVMHARQSAFDAMERQQDKHEIVAAAPPPPVAPIPAVAPSASPAKPDAVAKDSKDAKDAKKDDAKKDEAQKDAKKKKFAWVAPKSNPGAKAAPADTSGDDEKPEAKKTTKKGAKDDDGYTVASAGGGDDIPSKPEKVAVADKPEKKSSKADSKADKADKSEKTESKPKPKGGDDAVNVLKAAMGATENTL